MLDKIRIDPGTKPHLAKRDTKDHLGLKDKVSAYERLAKLHVVLERLQGRLFAEGKHSLLLVLQGLDASGKDGVIRRVFEGVNPQGCRVVSFKAPTSTELAARLPLAHPRGASRARRDRHLQPLALRGRRRGADARACAAEGLEAPAGHIVEWERMLLDEGTTIVKVFLNVSKEEQRQRLQERLDDPEKRWKFRKSDLDVRARFDDYLAAYDEVIEQTSTEHAPWYVVPADRNWVKATAVAELLVAALERIDPQLPEPEDGLEGLVVS